MRLMGSRYMISMFSALVYLSVLSVQCTFAESIFIFLDNSMSLSRNRINDSYKRDMKDILDIGGDNYFYFAPIGEEKAKDLDRIATNMTDKKIRDKNIDDVFVFTDLVTRITPSFEMYERTPGFMASETILIISDMEPDFDNRCKCRWDFNLADIRDVQGFINKLKNWIEKEDKKLIIVLHGWKQKVEKIIDRDLLRGFDETFEGFDRDISRAASIISGNTLEKNRSIEQRTANQHLVAKGLFRLEKKYGPKVKIQIIPPEIKNQTNTEGFLDILCGTLPVDDPNNEVCVQALKTDIFVRVDFDRISNLSNSLIGMFKNKVPAELYPGGPKRNIYMNRINRKISKFHDTQMQYHFRIKAQRRHPYHFPKIQVTSEKNNAISHVAVTQNMQPSDKNMLKWAARHIEEWLMKYINIDYPTPTKRKHIFLAYNDRNNRKRDLAAGYRFYTKTVPDNNHTNSAAIISNIQKTDPKGHVKISVPTEKIAGTSYLAMKAMYGNNRKDLILDPISTNEIRGSSHIDFDVSKYLVPYLFELSGAGEQQVTMEVVLQAGLSEETLVEKLRLSPRQTVTLKLMPGIYRVEVIPDNIDIRSWFLESLRVESRTSQQSQKTKEIQVRLDRDSQVDLIDMFFTGFKKGLQQDERDAALTSAHFLRELLSFTSREWQDTKDFRKRIQFIWQQVHELYFDAAKISTNESLLRRGMKEISLLDSTDTRLLPNSFQLLRAMFDVFLTGTSKRMESNPRLKVQYNEWITLLENTDIITEILASELRR